MACTVALKKNIRSNLPASRFSPFFSFIIAGAALIVVFRTGLYASPFVLLSTRPYLAGLERYFALAMVTEHKVTMAESFVDFASTHLVDLFWAAGKKRRDWHEGAWLGGRHRHRGTVCLLGWGQHWKLVEFSGMNREQHIGDMDVVINVLPKR